MSRAAPQSPQGSPGMMPVRGIVGGVFLSGLLLPHPIRSPSLSLTCILFCSEFDIVTNENPSNYFINTLLIGRECLKGEG